MLLQWRRTLVIFARRAAANKYAMADDEAPSQQQPEVPKARARTPRDRYAHLRKRPATQLITPPAVMPERIAAAKQRVKQRQADESKAEAARHTEQQRARKRAHEAAEAIRSAVAADLYAPEGADDEAADEQPQRQRARVERRTNTAKPPARFKIKRAASRRELREAVTSDPFQLDEQDHSELAAIEARAHQLEQRALQRAYPEDADSPNPSEDDDADSGIVVLPTDMDAAFRRLPFRLEGEDQLSASDTAEPGVALDELAYDFADAFADRRTNGDASTTESGRSTTWRRRCESASSAVEPTSPRWWPASLPGGSTQHTQHVRTA